MVLSLDSNVRQAVERAAARDPDYESMSASVMQVLYQHATIRDLVNRLRTRELVTCANQHDDPCSDVKVGSCPLRELNIACGHQDRIGADRGGKSIRTPGSAMVTLCDALIADGAPGAQELRRKVVTLVNELSVTDGAAYIGYRKLRCREEDFEFSALPKASLQNPIAHSPSLEDHRSAIIGEQYRLGQEMFAMRDEILALLETRVGESILSDVPVPRM